MACWCAWNDFRSFALPFEYHCAAGPTLTRRWTPLLSFLLVSSPLSLRGNFLILYDLYQGSTAQSIMHVWANGHISILRAEMCWLGLCPDNDWMFFLFTLQWPRVDAWRTRRRHSLLRHHRLFNLYVLFSVTSVWHVISAFTRLERLHCCWTPLLSCWVTALEARASTAKGRKGALPLINTGNRWSEKHDYSLREYSFFRLIYPEKFWNCSDCSVKLGHVHENRFLFDV